MTSPSCSHSWMRSIYPPESFSTRRPSSTNLFSLEAIEGNSSSSSDKNSTLSSHPSGSELSLTTRSPSDAKTAWRRSGYGYA